MICLALLCENISAHFVAGQEAFGGMSKISWIDCHMAIFFFQIMMELQGRGFGAVS